MLEILKFIFENSYHFFGVCFLLLIITRINLFSSTKNQNYSLNLDGENKKVDENIWKQIIEIYKNTKK